VSSSSGDSTHACPMPRLPVGWHHGTNDAAVSQGKRGVQRGAAGAAALQGASYGFGAPGCLLAASAERPRGSQLAASSPAGWWAMPAELASTPGRRADGAHGCRSSTYSPGGHPKRSGLPRQPRAGGRSPNQHQLLLHHFSSFTEPVPASGGYFDRQKQGNSGANPPQHDCAWTPPSRAVCF